MVTRSRLAGLAVALAALSGCGGVSASGVDRMERLRVVTTVAPITSIVASVAGDRAEIEGLVPEGTNSHTFEPPPSAAAALSEADVVFVNGLKLEEPTKELAEANRKDGAEIVELGTTVLPESQYVYDFSFPEEEGKPNPHLWTDPTWAVKYAAVVRDTLAKRDAANAGYYRENFAAFEAQATALTDALLRDQRTIPGPKALLTYHDAYAYFARTFGWDVVGAIQPDNFEDPTPRELARLIDQIRVQRVPTIFGSEVFPSKALKQIADETGVRYEDTLRDDDLPQQPGEREHSWLGLMRYNYVTMVESLGGKAATLRDLDISATVPDAAEYPQ